MDSVEVTIIEKATNKKIKGIIEAASSKDIVAFGVFSNKWREFIERKELANLYFVFKLRLVEKNEIVGLICLVDELVLSNAVEIRKIEVTSENRGRGKKYDRIAGCLIAFACQYSISRGLKGKTVLIPKAKLREHYCLKYGMAPFIGFLKIDEHTSVQLIEKYLTHQLPDNI